MTNEDRNPENEVKPGDAPVPKPPEMPPGRKPRPAAQTAEKEKKTPPGKFKLFLRNLLRGVIAAMILFAAGMLTTYFLFQKPNVSGLDSQIEALQGEKADLDAQIEALQGRVAELEPYEAENKVLRAALSDEELHVQVLSSLKDIQAAQYFIVLEQVDSARLSLSRTKQKLEELQTRLPADQQGVVDGMIQRLGLVVEGLDEDVFAAQSDLDVLTNSLLQLENTLFTAP